MTWRKQFDLVIKAIYFLLEHFAFSQKKEKKEKKYFCIFMNKNLCLLLLFMLALVKVKSQFFSEMLN